MAGEPRESRKFNAIMETIAPSRGWLLPRAILRGSLARRRSFYFLNVPDISGKRSLRAIDRAAFSGRFIGELVIPTPDGLAAAGGVFGDERRRTTGGRQREIRERNE